MRADDAKFVHALVDEVPELRPLMEEHVEDNFGEVLPHLFLADVARFVTANPREQATSSALAFLNGGLRSAEPERRDLISTGFVENLVTGPDSLREMRIRLGPDLRAEADRISRVSSEIARGNRTRRHTLGDIEIDGASFDAVRW